MASSCTRLVQTEGAVRRGSRRPACRRRSWMRRSRPKITGSLVIRGSTRSRSGGRASRAYFGQPPSLLTSAQAAFLAALPQRPSTYNPYRDATRARRRQERVIARMGVVGALNPDRVREAMDERLALAHEPAVFIAPHFDERVLSTLKGSPDGDKKGSPD